MTGDELGAALKRLGYSRAKAARELGVNLSTLWRQINRRDKPIFGPYAAAVECWLKHGGPE